MSNEEVEERLANKPLVESVLRMQAEAENKLRMRVAPIFIIGKNLIRGAVPFDKLDEFLRSLEG